MKIEAPTLRQSDGKVFIEAKVHRQGSQKVLWFAVPERFFQQISAELGDAFLVALLPQAMLCAENIEIEASVSERLLYNLQNYFIPMYGMVAPQCCELKPCHPL